MTNQDLLRLILEKIKTKFTNASEDCSKIYADFKNADPVEYSASIAKLEAYGDLLSYVAELYRQLNLGLLEKTHEN